MTVGELAERLKEFQPETDVFVLHGEGEIQRYFDIEIPGVKVGDRKQCVLIPVAERKS